MNLRKSLVRFGITAATVTAVIAGTATTASASIQYIGSGWENCPWNNVCMWENNNYVAGWGPIAANQNISNMWQPGGTFGFGNGPQDEISSLMNNTGNSICFFEHNDYRGLVFRVGPQEKWASLPSWINDKISSMSYC